ncbi:hypothetical protein [Flavobacterium sp. ACAM 123]|uniref:hypothetical protein n=1 Tax=Flavobacterium sp. ACAM 123 TaxID=1189620 RepID=UPI00031C3018|nr:hypothetical protein [Flavobacterium sp. ACAM 123]
MNRKISKLTKNKILEAKLQFTSIPPPIVLSLEILSKALIIKNNPLYDYSQVVDARALASSYLKNSKNKTDKYYNTVQIESRILNSYPKDIASFLALKQQIEQEKLLKKEREEKAASEAKAKAERDAIENKLRLEKEELARKTKIEADKIKNELAAIEAEKNRIIKAEADEKNRARTAELEKKYYKDLSFKKGFSSLGIQSGEIAKYGLLYETGSRKLIGFRMSARTSLTLEEDILSGKSIANKTEIELGPNFRLFKRFYLNIGAGYGYYDKVVRNDYAGTLSVEKTGYLVATSGLMIRISRVININGGVSFMDIDKEFYKPEITAGISFNLKKKILY